MRGAKKVENMDSEDLMTYCGGYCGQCALFPGFAALREAAALTAELIDVHGLQNWIPQAWLPEAENKFDFAEFRKGLAFFSDPESFFICRKCCQDGGGFSGCTMRKCCQERGLDVCFDCGDFPCNKMEWHPNMIKRAGEYKRLGKDAWMRQQEKKAKQGFELFTDKYYRIRAGENPPAPD
jgi:hypothetical protein